MMYWGEILVNLSALFGWVTEIITVVYLLYLLLLDKNKRGSMRNPVKVTKYVNYITFIRTTSTLKGYDSL